MKSIKEKLKKITKKSWMIIGSIIFGICIVGLVIFYSKNTHLWLAFFFQKDKNLNTEILQEDLEMIEEIIQKSDRFKKEDEYKNDVESATAYIQNTAEVQVAVVMNTAQSKIEDLDQAVSCGQITFVTFRVARPALLTNTLKALFENKVVSDFMPGNIIPAYHPKLTLQKVLIENNTAKIYLGGTFGGAQNGWCDSSLAIAQIAETAKTFSTIQTVEIYQNGSRIY